ncbi:MAG: hypothetical protein JWO79_1338 [Actinomycetia bacterium]|nr:hypothetical protein [Actinomycetes bacterium]
MAAVGFQCPAQENELLRALASFTREFTSEFDCTDGAQAPKGNGLATLCVMHRLLFEISVVWGDRGTKRRAMGSAPSQRAEALTGGSGRSG